MRTHLGPFFWLKTILASVTALVIVLTLSRPRWIEAVFGVDPDRSNGSFEWELVSVLGLLVAILTALALRDWQRTPPECACRTHNVES